MTLGEMREKKKKGSSSRIVDRRHTRIRRACDDCRGRKIKCNGNTPCLPCSLAHQECTYSFNGKSKYKGPMYIEELEQQIKSQDCKLKQLRSVLSVIFPQKSIDDLEAVEEIQKWVLEEKQPQFPQLDETTQLFPKQHAKNHLETLPNGNELLETMIEATGRLDIDGQGHCEYHGDFAGLAFLHQIGERCSQLMDANFEKKEVFSHLPLRQVFASKRLSLRGSIVNSTSMFHLPSRATAQHLTKVALEDASCLMNFSHIPSFNKLLDRIYSVQPEDYSVVEESFLPLLYVTLAIGELFVGGQQSQGGSASSVEQMKGIKYFRAGQALLDSSDCRDIISLQTIVSIIIYLQSSGLMHACYSYISIAISVSLQMGLHRSTVSRHLDPVQQETRKRIFWIIQTMETYATTLLGLPTTLNDDDIDQDLPLCIDDEHLDANGLSPTHIHSITPMAAVNAHIKLLLIMRKIRKEIYPRAKQLGSKKNKPYRVNYAQIITIEVELDEWFQNIPIPAQSESLQPDTLRTQLLLRLAYAHVQMVLYRPFIHHIVRSEAGIPPEIRSFACALACIKAARQIVWIVEELENRNLLIGAYWFTPFLTFFAVMALCMFIIGNPDDPTIDDTLKAAAKGREILSRLALDSVSAERCVTSLGSLFDRISLLCIRRRQSQESVSRSGYESSEDQSSSSVAIVSKDMSMVSDVSLSCEDGVDPLTLDMNLVMPSMPTYDNLPLDNGSTLTFEGELSSAEQSQWGLLAMMGPPLVDFSESSTLAAPMYGGLAPMEENHFFSYFNAT